MKKHPNARLYDIKSSIIKLDGNLSSYIESIQSDGNRAGLKVTVEHVPYKFQRKANQMMRIRLE